jgi:hypothetical protein
VRCGRLIELSWKGSLLLQFVVVVVVVVVAVVFVFVVYTDNEAS